MHHNKITCILNGFLTNLNVYQINRCKLGNFCFSIGELTTSVHIHITFIKNKNYGGKYAFTLSVIHYALITVAWRKNYSYYKMYKM